MKNILRQFLLLLLTLLLLCGVSSAEEDGTNLLHNASFEDLGSDGLPTAWDTDAYLTTVGLTLYSIVADDATDGQYSVQIENLDYNDARFLQTVTVKPSTIYRLSGYVKGWDTLDEGRGANLSIADVYVFSESVYESEDEWVYIETYGMTGEDQTQLTVFARLGGYSGESIGVARFDNLSLTEVDEVPDGTVLNLWYKVTTVQDADTLSPKESSAAWPWLLIVAAAYAAIGLYMLRCLQRAEGRKLADAGKQSMPVFVLIGLIASVIARLIVADNVSGYQVDVNCFLSWGNTFLHVGPADFYQSTSFCDYPPAYVYIMGLNAALANVLPLSAAAVHKLIPMACDLIAACLIYRIACKKHFSPKQAGILCLLVAFNPSIFLNSAAWCQIDSVLSLLLMLVVYFAVCGKWAIALPIYMLAVLVKPQALMTGFLGVAAAIMALAHDRKCWKQMLIGLGAALVTALVIVVPFSIHQGGISWLIDKYAETLSSYPYATVNTANLYYLFDCNWYSIAYTAPVMIPLTLLVLTLVWCAHIALREQKALSTFDWLTALPTFAVIVAGFGLGGGLSTASDWTHSIMFRFGGEIMLTRTSLLVIGLIGLAVAIIASALLLHRRKADWAAAELTASAVFALIFAGLSLTYSSFTLIGLAAMAYAFVLVLPLFIRSGKIESLALCGGILFVLLYVFGIKMHERYLFPALFLLGMAYAYRRDWRILTLLIAFSATVFVNEGIVLDNSLRLGSSMGHLNNDTQTLASMLAFVNVVMACAGLWTCRDVCLGGEETKATLEEQPHKAILPVRRLDRKPGDPRTFTGDASLHWCRRDWVLMMSVTLIYAVVALTNLGSTRAPQNPWKSTASDEQVIIDLGEHYDDVSMLYFCQVSYHDFSVATSDDGETWSDEYWAQMAEGQCYEWKYLVPSYEYNGTHSYVSASTTSDVQKLSGRYVRITAQQIGLIIDEVIFRDADGSPIPATVVEQLNARENSPNYSDAANLLDEQDTLEGEPSWYNGTYFDEIYHARTAYEHLNGTQPYETSHPPLGKVIMSLGIAIFGMTPFGWRFMGAVIGILMLPVMYLLAKQLMKKSTCAFAAMLMLALDCQHFTQTRIATIDSYPVFFILLSWLFMLRFVQRDIVREPLKKLLPDLLLAGFFMGCGIASKWIGIYSGAGLAIVYFWMMFRHLRMANASRKLLETEKNLSREDRQLLTLRADTTLKRVMVLCLWCVLFFVAIPLAIYLLSYIPYFAYAHYTRLSDYLRAVWNAQVSMFSYHSEPGRGMDHPFYSPWYEWPLNKRPMYYASPSYVSTPGWSYALWCFGNPAVWTAGLLGIAYVLFVCLKRHRYTLREGGETLHLSADSWDITHAFLLIAALSQFLPWVLVPRGTYIYHYFATTPFLMLCVAVLLHDLCKWRPKLGRVILWSFLALCLIMFVAYFPYASGVLTPTWWLDFMSKFLRLYH